ncbi:MAG: hypothetical protein QW767_03665 [Thermoprotei archaeon]
MNDLVAVIGRPIEHSRTPALHFYASRKCGRKLLSFRCELEDSQLEPFVRFVRGSQRFLGFNVTMPFKTKIIDQIDHCSPESRFLSAVNLVVKDAGRLMGYNTDWLAVRGALADRHLNADSALIVGAGGAAAAATYALNHPTRLASKIYVYNRSETRLSAFKKIFPDAIPVSFPSDVGSFDMVVNAIPVSLEESNMFSNLWKSARVRVDFNYTGRQDRKASESGGDMIDGYEILARQAQAGLKILLGCEVTLQELVMVAREGY